MLLSLRLWSANPSVTRRCRSATRALEDQDLPLLEVDNVIAGTTSAASTPIGDSRALYERGILSHLTSTAERAGGSVGMPSRRLLNGYWRQPAAPTICSRSADG
jgi:hypothetical protein